MYTNLIEEARKAGRVLYGEELIFDINPNQPIRETFLKTEEKELAKAMEIEEKEVTFGTWCYVFFPVSKKPAVDVADEVTLRDPSVYDTNGKCYFYCGEESSVIIMHR